MRRLDMAVIEGESILRRIERQQTIGKGGLAGKDEHSVRSKLEMKEVLPIKDDVAILKAEEVLNDALGEQPKERW